jgi:peptidyl-prolyl cis-trans isomerase SurA
MFATIDIRALTSLAATLALAASIVCHPIAHSSSIAQTTPSQKWAAKTKTDRNDAPAASKGNQAIVVLVNDEPVTAYQIEQRARLLSLNANISEQAKENFQRLVKADSTTAKFRELQEEVIRTNQGKSREQIIAIFQERQKQLAMTLQKQAIDGARAGILPRLKKDAKEELIDERLKVQEAKKLGIEITDDDVKRMLQSLAEKNKMNYDQFSQHLKGMGVDISTMGERFRAQRAWRDLVGRRYGAQVSVTQRDVDRVLSSAATEAGDDTVELQVSKITLGLPAKIDQTSLAKRFADAETLRRKFSGCRSLGDLAKTVSGAKLDDLRFIKPATVPEPTRSMLLSAKDGDMLPPSTTNAGVEIYAVCGRRAAAAANDAQRTKTQEELQYQQLESLAQRHMRNLRQDAHIEYR